MTSGTRPGILVRELFLGDGPHARIADDFLTNRCSACTQPVGRDGIHHEAGYLCAQCWTRMSMGA